LIKKFTMKNFYLKSILTFLFLFAVHQLQAQNWNTVLVNDTTYYNVVDTSNYNFCYRDIYVDSSITNGSYFTNYFYPSMRLNKFDIIDTSAGDTWLGKKNIHFINGDELYFNKYEDTILIKTLANINDTWKMCTDTLGIQYWATVISTSTLTIDGMVDSIKTISLQAIQTGNPVASVYNSLPIVLSKAHGFYTCFEFYGFPNYVIPQGMSGNNPFPFNILPLKHQRIESSISKRNNYDLDLEKKYKPGNEWIDSFYYSYLNDYNRGYIYDSIIASQLISSDSIQVTRYRHKCTSSMVFPIGANPYEAISHIYSTFTDTVVHAKQPFGLKYYLTEGKFLYSSINYWVGENKVDTISNNKIKIKTHFYHSFNLSGNYNHTDEILENYGSTFLYYEDYTTIATEQTAKILLYAKYDSCIIGTKFSFKTLSIPEYTDLSNFITIYPNPTNDDVHIALTNQIELQGFILTDLFGRKIVETHTNQSIIHLSDLQTGLYLVHIKTNKGELTKKIMKL